MIRRFDEIINVDGEGVYFYGDEIRFADVLSRDGKVGELTYENGTFTVTFYTARRDAIVFAPSPGTDVNSAYGKAMSFFTHLASYGKTIELKI